MTPVYKIKIPGSTADIFAKLESQNPTGTHKDRSLTPWIAQYVKEGVKEFAISSSGNSALAAARCSKDLKVRLHVFVRQNLSKEKLLILRANQYVILHLGKTPRKDAFRFAKEHGIINLRASTDDKALMGYKEIAFELIEQVEKIDQLFIPTSSGATLVGIFQGFKERGVAIPALYAAQTAKVYPIASYFDKDFSQEFVSRATAIVDNIARRKDEVVKILEKTGGGGFVISNKELGEAKKIFEQSGAKFAAGWQSLLSLAGFLKWRKQNILATETVSVCLFTD